MESSQNTQKSLSIINKEIENILITLPKRQLVKIGPDNKEDKTDFIIKWNSKYRKYFTNSKEYYKEIDEIEKFNQFSKKYNIAICWPSITERNDKKLYFEMMDIENEWLNKINFFYTPHDNIIQIYNQYRETFNKYEKHIENSHDSIKTIVQSSKQKLIKTFLDWWNPIAKQQYFKKQKNIINKRYTQWQENVQNMWTNIPWIDIQNKLIELQKKFEWKIHLQYNFNRFFWWHVFSDGIHHKLIDFDSVGYHIQWNEEISLLRSAVLMNVSKFSNYEERKKAIFTRLVSIKQNNWENLTNLLMFQKLLWTIYADYGYLLANKSLKDNSKFNNHQVEKWVERCSRFLNEYFELKVL